jgi:hypothetical protein
MRYFLIDGIAVTCPPAVQSPAQRDSKEQQMAKIYQFNCYPYNSFLGSVPVACG